MLLRPFVRARLKIRFSCLNGVSKLNAPSLSTNSKNNPAESPSFPPENSSEKFFINDVYQPAGKQDAPKDFRYWLRRMMRMPAYLSYTHDMMYSTMLQAERDEFFTIFNLPDSFAGHVGLRTVHIWLCCQRLIADKYPREYMRSYLESFWPLLEQMLIRVPGMNAWVLDRHLKQVMQHIYGSWAAFDLAMSLQHADKDVFTGALWRCAYASDMNVNKARLIQFRNYVLRQRAMLMSQDRVPFFEGKLVWAPLFVRNENRGVSKEQVRAKAQALAYKPTGPPFPAPSVSGGFIKQAAAEPSPRKLPSIALLIDTLPTAEEEREAAQLDLSKHVSPILNGLTIGKQNYTDAELEKVVNLPRSLLEQIRPPDDPRPK